MNPIKSLKQVISSEGGGIRLDERLDGQWRSIVFRGH